MYITKQKETHRYREHRTIEHNTIEHRTIENIVLRVTVSRRCELLCIKQTFNNNDI